MFTGDWSRSLGCALPIQARYDVCPVTALNHSAEPLVTIRAPRLYPKCRFLEYSQLSAQLTQWPQCPWVISALPAALRSKVPASRLATGWALSRAAEG